MKFIKKKIVNKLTQQDKSSLISKITDRFKDCADFECNKIVSSVTGVEIYKLSMGQFVDKLLVDETILRPIAERLDTIKNTTDLLSIIKNGEIYHIDAKVETDVDKIVSAILQANFVLVCENQAYLFNVTLTEKKALEVKGTKALKSHR